MNRRKLVFLSGIIWLLVATNPLLASDLPNPTASAPAKMPCELAEALAKEIYTYAYTTINKKSYFPADTIDTSIQAIKLIANASDHCADAEYYSKLLAGVRPPENSIVTTGPAATPVLPGRRTGGGSFEGTIKRPIDEMNLLQDKGGLSNPTLIQQTIKSE